MMIIASKATAKLFSISLTIHIKKLHLWEARNNEVVGKLLHSFLEISQFSLCFLVGLYNLLDLLEAASTCNKSSRQ